MAEHGLRMGVTLAPRAVLPAYVWPRAILQGGGHTPYLPCAPPEGLGQGGRLHIRRGMGHLWHVAAP